MEKSVRNQLQAACNITYSIPGLKELPARYRKNTPYTDAGFIDGFSLFTGGPGDIDVGLIGMADFGRKKLFKHRYDVLIAFRGTVGILDWLNDCRANQVDSPFSKGKVHQGFLNSVKNLEEPILNKLDELMLEYPDAMIYITGHSKGGALATLMGFCVLSRHKDYLKRIKIATFGSPRVGDSDFCDDYPFEHYRYESFLDLVPHLSFSEQESSLLINETNFFKKHPAIRDFLHLPPYKHVGKRRVFKQMKKQPHLHKHSDLPVETDDHSLETLNSFQSIVAVMDIHTLEAIVDAHVFDYDDMPDDL